jgi:hypothetical protein
MTNDDEEEEREVKAKRLLVTVRRLCASVPRERYEEVYTKLLIKGVVNLDLFSRKLMYVSLKNKKIDTLRHKVINTVGAQDPDCVQEESQGILDYMAETELTSIKLGCMRVAFDRMTPVGKRFVRLWLKRTLRDTEENPVEYARKELGFNQKRAYALLGDFKRKVKDVQQEQFNGETEVRRLQSSIELCEEMYAIKIR